ncbi:hypothetical protein ANO14919_090130 [Xylariales sp. No.14919]|nr:hypothetical protein ANO14919_090130 [Xylariales sp. No.14919]
MPFDTVHPSLKTELSKLAKRGNIQAGLPFIMRGLPVAAILAGEAIAEVSGGSNRIEERMLGPDETFVLNMPGQNPSTSIVQSKRDSRQEGVTMMCVRCWKTRGELLLTSRLDTSGQSEVGAGTWNGLHSFGRANRQKNTLSRTL